MWLGFLLISHCRCFWHSGAPPEGGRARAGLQPPGEAPAAGSGPWCARRPAGGPQGRTWSPVRSPRAQGGGEGLREDLRARRPALEGLCRGPKQERPQEEAAAAGNEFRESGYRSGKSLGGGAGRAWGTG